jgi:hypothetical protein
MNGDNKEKLVTDDEIEDLVFSLIEQHVTDDARKKAVRDWLTQRVACYQAVRELSSLDDEPL